MPTGRTPLPIAAPRPIAPPPPTTCRPGSVPGEREDDAELLERLAGLVDVVEELRPRLREPDVRAQPHLRALGCRAPLQPEGDQRDAVGLGAGVGVLDRELRGLAADGD